MDITVIKYYVTQKSFGQIAVDVIVQMFETSQKDGVQYTMTLGTAIENFTQESSRLLRIPKPW